MREPIPGSYSLVLNGPQHEKLSSIVLVNPNNIHRSIIKRGLRNFVCLEPCEDNSDIWIGDPNTRKYEYKLEYEYEVSFNTNWTMYPSQSMHQSKCQYKFQYKCKLEFEYKFEYEYTYV
jgi:hypothetical protein